MNDQTPSVLFVQVDKTSRELSEDILHQQYSYKVEIAANDQVAWERVRQAAVPYAVVVLNYMSQSLAGDRPRTFSLDFLQRLRIQYPETAVILCTDSTRAGAQEALRAGVSRALTKPVDAAELAIIIEYTIEYQRLKRSA